MASRENQRPTSWLRVLPLTLFGLWALPASAEVTSAESVEDGGLASSSAPDSGWQFSASPYLWMSGMKGDMGVVEAIEPVAIDLSFGDILSHLKFVLMGGFDARKDRFVAAGDIQIVSLSASKNIDIREADFLDAELKQKTFFGTATAGYRVIDQDRLFLDLMAGGRINYAKTELDLQGPQRSFSGSKSKTWFDPIIAARFQAPLGQRLALQTYGDIGGFGVGSHLTWQLLGVVEYNLSSHWSLYGGWRHFDVDYDHKGFVFDAAIDGPILGATYRF